MKFQKYFLLIIISLNLFSQDKDEIPIEEIRDNKIKALLEIVKENRDIYVSEDKKRLNKFINLNKFLELILFTLSDHGPVFHHIKRIYI